MPALPAQDGVRRLADGAPRGLEMADDFSIGRRGEATLRQEVGEEQPVLALRRLLAGRVCVLGVGNRTRGDDGAGSLVAERLAGRTDALVIDAGAVPENYLEKVARWCPDSILIVDAVDFGGAPGDLRLLTPQAVGPAGLSSHALSLQMGADYLKARTKARLALLAIQPADLRLRAKLSEQVAQAVEQAVEILSAELTRKP